MMTGTKCSSQVAISQLQNNEHISNQEDNVLLYSRTHSRVPVRRTVTIHIFRAGVARFNICFPFFQVLLRPHLHFYWPFILWLNYCTLWHRRVLFFFGLPATLVCLILSCSRHTYQFMQDYLEII